MKDKYVYDSAEVESNAQQDEFEAKQRRLLNEFDFTREPINPGECNANSDKKAKTS